MLSDRHKAGRSAALFVFVPAQKTAERINMKKITAVLLTVLIVFGIYHFTETPSVLNSGDILTIYYIDVGQADSTLIVCGDETMLIDGGNISDSSLIYSFLKERGISRLNYIIATHPHEDHIGGLSGALNYAQADVIYCPVKEYDSTAFRNFVKYLDAQNKQITVPEAGYEFSLGKAKVQILGPQKKYSSMNNMSIVLKITFGKTSFLFTGDAEREAEHDLINSGYDLSSDVLKAGHHGSASSSSYPFLYHVMPEYAVISCAEDSRYEHPDSGTLSRLSDIPAVVYRTDLHGTITCISDGQNINFFTEKTPALSSYSRQKSRVLYWHLLFFP